MADPSLEPSALTPTVGGGTKIGPPRATRDPGGLHVSQLPSAVHAVVIGAGIHGLSTGWHLGLELGRRRRGLGHDVVVLDKTGVGAGASGIACGCVRNLYMTERLTATLHASFAVCTFDAV